MPKCYSNQTSLLPFTMNNWLLENYIKYKIVKYKIELECRKKISDEYIKENHELVLEYQQELSNDNCSNEDFELIYQYIKKIFEDPNICFDSETKNLLNDFLSEENYQIINEDFEGPLIIDWINDFVSDWINDE